MEQKQIEILCPCCNTLLTVDVLTRSVLRHAPPEQVDETGKAILDEGRWDAANQRVSSRGRAAQDKFEAALGKEKVRERELEELFEKAKRKAQGGASSDPGEATDRGEA